jgi:tRNA pseudouridine32 synthase / 23S rRNA pseudouridine746 synthase
MKTYQFLVSKYSPQKISLGEVLVQASGLKNDLITEAASKGAVWLQKNSRGKILRERSAAKMLDPSDKITFYYDLRVLKLPELQASQCLYETSNFGIWLKAAGVMPQGTQTGDHTSLLRYVEKVKKKEVFLIHRLDRETEGVMMVGYSSQAAARLSKLFQDNKVHKTYQAIVLGEMPIHSQGTINSALDDKEAISHYKVLALESGQSLLEVTIDTGRFHQIRRHLDGIGHPVMGDPKYGRGNKNRAGLKLLAKSLNFVDPWSGQDLTLSLDYDLTF